MSAATVERPGPRIAVLTVLSPHAWIIINALAGRFGPLAILSEERQPRFELFLKRARRQRIVTVMGQVLFVVFQRLLGAKARKRIAEIVSEQKLDIRPRNDCRIDVIGSVNSENARQRLAELDPEVVLVLGTRMIGQATLASVRAPLINIHAGITPKYRGQAGGYWALASDDAAHAGVTVHLVDRGMDTGPVLDQANFTATTADSFETYFYLQYAAARPLVVKAVEDALNHSLKPRTINLPSQQFYHPTLWGYVWTAFRKGVW